MSETQISSLEIEKYMYLVKRIAWNFKKKLPPSIYIDDLIQCGCIGLMDAFKKFDLSQGASFETYAGIRIRGEILDELRRNNTQPISIMRKAKKLREATCRVESRTHKEATKKEVAKELNISVSKLCEMETSVIRSLEVFYDDHCNYDHDYDDGGIDVTTPGDTDLKHFQLPEDILEKEEFLFSLKKILKRIPEREKMAFELYFFEKELTQREIGVIFDVSEVRINQILKIVIIKIQSKLGYLYDASAA